MAEHQTTPSGLEVVSAASDLAAGPGMVIFTLAPFALPVLARTALAAVALLIPAPVGAVPVAAFLLGRRRWRLGDRRSGAAEPAGPGDAGAGRRGRRSVGALGRPVVLAGPSWLLG